MTSIFPSTKEDFTAENGVTYTWEDNRWRTKAYKLDDSKLEDYLPLAGGEMEGDISAGGHIVSNLGNPENAGHATPRRYVDEGDQELQLEIDNLKQEIEHLAPSFERGEWILTSEWPGTGQYGLFKSSTYTEAVERINDAYAECILACEGDAGCASDCNRQQGQALDAIKEYDPEEGGSGFIDVPERDWELVNRVVFYEEDAIGGNHNFEDVEEGQYMDLYNKADDGYFIAKVLGKSQDPNNDDIYIIDVQPIQWSDHPPDGRALVKFFTVEDGVDVTEFVRKSGDTITGPMVFEDRIDITKEQDTEKADNSFVLNGPIWNSGQNKIEMRPLLKDYRPKASAQYSGSVFYYGLIDTPQSIVNLGYLEDKYLPLAGGLMTGNLTISFMADEDKDRFAIGNGSYTSVWVPRGHEMHCRGRMYVNSFRESDGSREDKNKLATIEEARDLAGDVAAEDYVGKSGTQIVKTADWNLKGPYNDTDYNYIHIKGGKLYLYHIPVATNDSWVAQWGQTKSYVHNPQSSVKIEADVNDGSNKVFDVRPQGYEDGQSAFSVRGNGGVKAGKDSANAFMAEVGNDVVTKAYFDANKGGGKVILESGSTTPTLEKGQMFLNTTTKIVHIGT